MSWRVVKSPTENSGDERGMGSVLITFLGRSSPEPKRYRFRDNGEERAIVAGLAVFAYLRNQERPPDKLVVFGTNASRWDILVETLVDEGSRPSAEIRALRSQLGRKVDAGSVTAGDLAALTSKLTEKLEVKECQLEIIPIGESEPQQVELLGHFEKAVTSEDCLTLDLTHALRHLPMLGLLSALQLQRLKQVTIKSMFYSALDLPEEPDVAQVIELDGLLHIARWIEALNRYDSTGNYALFCEVLSKDGMPREVVKDLEDAALWEQLQRFDTAAQPLQRVLGWLELNKLTGPGLLFQEQLRTRLQWITGDPLERQKNLALNALSRNDYFTATIFGFEAYVTILMMEQVEQGHRNIVDIFDSVKRTSTRRTYEQEEECAYYARGADGKVKKPLEELPVVIDEKKAEFCKFKLYRDFQNLRNAFAHGSEPMPSIKPILEDAVNLRQTIRRAFKGLLQCNVPKEHATGAGEDGGR